jgi:putative endonuclease
MSTIGLRGLFHRIILAKPFTRLYDQFQKQLSLGDRGEILAERFFLRQGWIVLARSYSTELGEIDLIAVDQQTVVFVEVKTRTDTSKGLPEDAVDDDKERRIAQMAEQYIRRHQLEKQRIRFDIFSIVWDQNSSPITKHYRDAFDAPLKFGN